MTLKLLKLSWLRLALLLSLNKLDLNAKQKAVDKFHGFFITPLFLLLYFLKIKRLISFKMSYKAFFVIMIFFS